MSPTATGGPRPPAPDDIYLFRIPTAPRLSHDGRRIAFTVQSVASRRDAYRHAVWLADVPRAAPAGSAEGGASSGGGAFGARQTTLGVGHDGWPRFSPDGRTLAFLSDRSMDADQDAGGTTSASPSAAHVAQVHLLPLAGGEARPLTNLPLGVDGFEWSPDGTRLIAWSASLDAALTARGSGSGSGREPDAEPESDYHYIDRLTYLYNGRGFVYHRRSRLWLVDVATGSARRLTDGLTDDLRPAWSPDGSRIAFAANRRTDSDLYERLDIHVLHPDSGETTRVTGGDMAYFTAPEWLPDGRTLAVLGHRFTSAAGTRSDIWLFAADGSDAGPDGGRNLSAPHDLMAAAGVACDLAPNEEPRLVASPDGAWLTVLLPDAGSYDVYRIATADGRLERLTKGPHVVTAFDQVTLADGRTLIAYVQSDATRPSEVHLLDLDGRGSPSSAPRRVTRLNDDALSEINVVEPVERWVECDGRRIQGWLFPARGSGAGAPPPPLVAQIHGGPHAFYAWAPTWEFQVLAGAGLSVWASNPRGSDGYGEAFNAANFRDWGPGPMRDVIAGIEALVADGLANPARLGVTGGSYGGYLTNWILANDQRFRAGLTARCASDMTMLMLTGDISGGEFGRQEFGTAPWEEPDYYREISPLTYAANIRTPLLIQHSEKDLRTTIGQAEALFTVLRSLGRPVRLMRVPEETHELTRSGTPFRRVENLVQVRDWFAWFLIRGRRALPPVPKVRGGR